MVLRKASAAGQSSALYRSNTDKESKKSKRAIELMHVVDGRDLADVYLPLTILHYKHQFQQKWR